MSQRAFSLGFTLLFTGIVFSLASGTALAEPPAPVGAKPAVDIDALVKAYREFGLPVPPADAPLVTICHDYRNHGEELEKIYQLAFLLQKKTDGKPALLLVGTEYYQPQEGEVITPVEPQAVNAASVEARWWCTFSVNAGLAAAIQCKIRGYDALASAILKTSLAVSDLPTLSIYNKDFDEPPPAMTALAQLAWAHWGNELTRQGTDRAAIARQIRALFTAVPWLKTNEAAAVLASLEAAMVPSHAGPGSIDAMIDDLLDIDTDPDHYRTGDVSGMAARDRLLLRGFEAVPALIAHIDDDRLTRGVDYGRGNTPSLNSRVSNIVCGILGELAGQDLGKHWLDPERGWVADKATAQAWWKQAGAVGEEAYMVAHVFRDGADRSSYPNDPSQVMLDIIAARYPKHLLEIYKTIVEKRPNMDSDSVASKISQSSFPREQKLAVFLPRAVDKNLERRFVALNELSRLDEQAFVKLYLKALDDLPQTPEGPYWLCKETNIAWLAWNTSDPRAWDALKRTAARVDVGLRMQILWSITSCCVGGCCVPVNQHHRETLELLAGFLDDTQSRDVTADKKRYEGPCAGSQFPQLAVRDLAAMSIASVLKLKVDVPPNKKWKPDQWAQYRSQIKAALEREPR